jgi:hypothetical protein
MSEVDLLVVSNADAGSLAATLERISNTDLGNKRKIFEGKRVRSMSAPPLAAPMAATIAATPTTHGHASDVPLQPCAAQKQL